ncbi:MAG: hypothetical protein ACC631_07870 [Halocynthiibacter sp.]
MKFLEPFWARLLLTILAILAARYLGGLLWGTIFSSELPGYLAGLVGGLVALPVWMFLKRFGPPPK